MSIKNLLSGEEATCEAGGLFFAVGHTPNTGFLNHQVGLEKSGHIKVKGVRTDIPRVYAAGDVYDAEFCQVATAIGFSCMAAQMAQRDLTEVGMAD